MGFNVDVICWLLCIEIIFIILGVSSLFGLWVDLGFLIDVDCEDGILWCVGRFRIDILEFWYEIIGYDL